MFYHVALIFYGVSSGSTDYVDIKLIDRLIMSSLTIYLLCRHYVYRSTDNVVTYASGLTDCVDTLFNLFSF